MIPKFGRSEKTSLRVVVRLSSFAPLLLATLLLASCSLASPPPVEQPGSQALQQPPVQQTAQPVELPTRRPSVSAGAALYQQKCVDCHGAQGHGDGAQAVQIQAQFGSPVADLTGDVIARATTPEQWYDVVSNGNLQKGMPGFAGSLDVDQRWDVIAYAWSLAAPSSQIAHGKDVYIAQCAQCHGDTGKGDGKDARGKLPDFTDFSALAQVEPGRWDQALASAHVPSFAGTLSEGDRRAAIDYVRTFAYDYAAVASAPAAGKTPPASTGELPANPAGPAAPITIEGTIVNGTAGMSVPDNLTMTLYLVPHQGNPQDVISRTFMSGIGGHYSITDTQANSTSLLAVGAVYKDLNFYSDVMAYQQPTVTLPITIYESTTDVSQVKVDTLHIIAMPGQGGLAVSEVYVLSNNGDRFVAGFGLPVMHFALPADATNLQMDSATQQVLVRSGDGLDYYDGIPVGKDVQQIIYQYTLPVSTTSLSRLLYHPVGSVNLLVQGDPGSTNVTSDRLTAVGTQAIQGTNYQQFTASDLQANQTLSLSIGVPASSSLDWRILLGVALVLVGVVGIFIWQRSQKKQPAVSAARRMEIQKEALIDQIAALDDEFAEGKIDELNYKARRTKLKEKLVKLMSEE